MNIETHDNSKEISAEIKAALLRGLEKCGLVAEGYAKKLCPVDTGNLRNSITHVIDEQEPAAIIGTDSEYGAYVELGTGIYAEGGGGRPTPWVYQDAKGNWHYTRGNKAQPFLKPAAADHVGQYRDILESELKNETIKAIEAIIKRGNDAEIRRKGDGYIVLEVKKTIKYSASAQ